MTGPGKPKKPKCWKKERHTVRLRPHYVQFIKDHKEINIHQLIENMLVDMFGEELAEKYVTFEIIKAARQSSDKVNELEKIGYYQILDEMVAYYQKHYPDKKINLNDSEVVQMLIDNWYILNAPEAER